MFSFCKKITVLMAAVWALAACGNSVGDTVGANPQDYHVLTLTIELPDGDYSTGTLQCGSGNSLIWEESAREVSDEEEVSYSDILPGTVTCNINFGPHGCSFDVYAAANGKNKEGVRVWVNVDYGPNQILLDHVFQHSFKFSLGHDGRITQMGELAGVESFPNCSGGGSDSGDTGDTGDNTDPSQDTPEPSEDQNDFSWVNWSFVNYDLGADNYGTQSAITDDHDVDRLKVISINGSTHTAHWKKQLYRSFAVEEGQEFVTSGWILMDEELGSDDRIIFELGTDGGGDNLGLWNEALRPEAGVWTYFYLPFTTTGDGTARLSIHLGSLGGKKVYIDDLLLEEVLVE